MNSRQIGLLARATVLLVALSLTAGLHAGPLMWDVEGVALRQGAGVGAYSVAQNSQGYSLVVWCDLRNGSDDLFAQLISPAGVPQWADGGAVVAAHPSEQVNPVAVAVNGGWIVFWIDHRHGCGSNIDPGWGDIYAQKLSDTGQRLWSANQHTGVSVDINTNAQVVHSEPLVAVADGSGGALVAWTSYGAGARFVLAQHVTGSGQLLWASPLSVADTMQMSYGMSGTGDANGNLFLGWYERRSNMYKLRTARITPDGVRAWGGSGVYVNTEDAMPSQRPQFCPDGAGGCYVGWVRNFSSPEYDIFVQRLDSTGEALWNPGGVSARAVPFSQLGYDFGMSLALSRTGSVIDGCVLAWCEGVDWPTGAIINSQKVSPAGVVLWDTAGVCIVSGTCGDSTVPWRVEPKVISDQSGGLVCIWRDNVYGATLDGDLYACRLDSAGVSQWGTECTPVWVSPAAQTSAVPVAGPNGTFVFWIDIASGASSLRYQYLDQATGAGTLAEGGVSLHSGICGGAEHARSLMLSPDRYAAVWEDTRSWTDHELYYQIFDENGQALGPVNGSLLTPGHPSESSFQQSSASLCNDGSGGFYAVFLQYTTGTSLPLAAHVSATGDLLSPPEGIALSRTSSWIGDRCHAVPDGNGGCYVVWWAYDAMWLGKLRVQRIAASGETVWDEPVTLNETATVHQELRDVVVGAEGSCTIIYMEAPYESSSLYGVNVQPDGEVAWTTFVGANSPWYSGFGVESDGDGGFACAWETDNGTESCVRAQHVSSTGALLWPSPGTQVASGRNYVRNIVQDGLGNVFVGWISSESAIYLQKLNSSGTLVWQVRRQVAAGAQPWVMRIMRDGGSGLFVCWDDHRGLRPHIYATHVDGEGQAVDESYWANGGGIVSTTWDAQEEPSLCPDGYGGMIVVYTDNKGIEEVGEEPPQIYAQRIFDGFTSAPEPPARAPREFALHQNYPNPFNPTTVIAFDLAHDGRTMLEVFDVLGRRVMTLVDGALPAGEHRVTLDAASLPSGTYIYRLQAVEFTQSRKMLLLK